MKASGWGETIRTVVYAVIIALGIRTFAYEPFNIPSGSMIPTLLVGDFLFVSKFSYGYSRYSLPFSPPVIADRIFASQPERGDVVVFKLPKDNKTDYIKRLIGLPGDRVQVKDGILHVNGKPVERRLATTQEETTYLGQVFRSKEYIETLPGGRRHRIREESDKESYDNTAEYVVPKEHFFFMGDNRDSSLDSRAKHHVGFVPFVNLVGRAEFLFFSRKEGDPWWHFWRWPADIRWGRIGDGIE